MILTFFCTFFSPSTIAGVVPKPASQIPQAGARSRGGPRGRQLFKLQSLLMQPPALKQTISRGRSISRWAAPQPATPKFASSC